MPLVSYNCPSCAAPLTGPGPMLICTHCGNEFRVADQPAAPVFSPPLPDTNRTRRQRFVRLRKLGLPAQLAILGGLVLMLMMGILLLRVYAGGYIWEYRIINDAALSPDGKRLASVHGQGFNVKGTLRIWDTATGQPLQRLDGIDTPMWVVRWSPDGRMLATGGHHGSIQLWDTTTWQPLNRLEGASGFIKQLAWSPDSRRVATGDALGVLRVWDATDGKPLVNSSLHSKDIVVIVWSPDGKYIATGSWDYAAIIFDVASGKLLHRFDDKSYVTCLAWSPDSQMLATGGLSNVVKIFEATSGTQRQNLQGHKSSILSLAWSPDGKLLASTDNSNTARVWEVATGTPLQVLENEGYDTNIMWSLDGKQLASGGNGIVRVWDAASGQLHKLTGHKRETKIDIVGWSADGTQLFTLGGYDATLRVWDVSAQKELHLMKVSLIEALQRTLF